MERPWIGPIALPMQFRNTPEGRRQIQQFDRHAEAAVAANLDCPAATTSPFKSLLPILVKHLPILELKEALTPKYSGDIRYKAIEIERKGTTTLPTSSGQPEQHPGFQMLQPKRTKIEDSCPLNRIPSQFFHPDLEST